MDVNVISMEDAGITVDVVEDGTTFEENSMKKAVQIMEVSGKITLADDSGLEIDAMDKAPGVYSARFMGEDTPYPERFRAIFEKLEGVPEVGAIWNDMIVAGIGEPDETGVDLLLMSMDEWKYIYADEADEVDLTLEVALS